MAKIKYSKKVREEAALICAIAASTPEFSYSVVAKKVGVRGDAISLSGAAWSHCANNPAYWTYLGPVLDAEAEALIRTGWSP